MEVVNVVIAFASFLGVCACSAGFAGGWLLWHQHRYGPQPNLR
jgi:hypothetical protein